MDLLKKLAKLSKLLDDSSPLELEPKKFKLELVCEGCGLYTNQVYKANDSSLLCFECLEAHKRRTRLMKADEEFGDT